MVGVELRVGRDQFKSYDVLSWFSMLNSSLQKSSLVFKLYGSLHESW